MSALEQYHYQKEFYAEPPKVESYVLRLDRDKYQEAQSLRFTDPDKYFEVVEQLNAYTEFQMQTSIGERLNVLQSTYRYDIKEGMLYGENTNEAFLDMIKRGRDYRRKNGNPQDHSREDAEVIGMEIIQSVLCDSNTEIGTTMLSLSPPGGKGSIYKHNFYDVLTLKQDNKGQRFVEANRYSASLTSLEYLEKVQELDPNYSIPLDEKEDVYFLSNPILLKEKGEDLADDIHRHMHATHAYMERDDFELVLDIIRPYIDKYLASLQDDPTNDARQGMIYNAILNKADEAADTIMKNRQAGKASLFELKGVTDDDIYYYGAREVRALDVGCGFSGGYEVGVGGLYGGEVSPFSVAEFGASTQKSEKLWSYHKGDCRLCRQKEILIGPCKICKTCEKKFD